MKPAARRRFLGLHSPTFALAACASVFCFETVVAEDGASYALLPDSFVGLTHGTLQPQSTYRAYVGSSQPSIASSDGQTGRQVYFGGLRYRGEGDWQFGASISIFDDEPAEPINGSVDSLTYVGTGLDLKYQLYNHERLSVSLLAGVEAVSYGRGGAFTSSTASDEEWFVAGTVSFPVTYQLNSSVWVTGEVGYTQAKSGLLDEPGFGARAFGSAGLTYQISDRLFAYGAIKALAREIDDGVDASDGDTTDHLYTFGGQFALTPQSALNIYVTNMFSGTPAGDDFLFFPDKTEPVYGLQLSYFPSGRGVGEAAPTFRPAIRSEDGGTRLADGYTVKGPHTLAADRTFARLSFGSQGQSALSLYYASDPDFQFELSFEDYALEAGNAFRSEAEEDVRYMIGGRWQAMDEAYGQAFNLGFSISAGRASPRPSIGSIFAAATASKSLGVTEVGVNVRSALYTSETLAGVGVLVSNDLGDAFTAIGEYTSLMDGDAVWSTGLRYAPKQHPLSVDLFATNAAGLNGVGSLLSNDATQIGLSIQWEGVLDMF